MDAVFLWISQYGYPALFVLLMLGIAGLPVPDETLLVFCGYLIWRGRLHPTATFLAGFGGSACGITLSYLLGRVYGNKVLEKFGPRLGLTPEHLERIHAWFGRVGSWLLAVGYFIPGVRHFTALVAGSSQLRWATFAVFAYTGAAFWVATFLSLGYGVGEKWHQTSEAAHLYALYATAALGLVLAIAWLIRWIRRRQSS